MELKKKVFAVAGGGAGIGRAAALELRSRGAAVNMTKAFLPALLRHPTASPVNVSSRGAILPVPGQSAYGASKAAVRMLTEGLYAELSRLIPERAIHLIAQKMKDVS